MCNDWIQNINENVVINKETIWFQFCMTTEGRGAYIQICYNPLVNFSCA